MKIINKPCKINSPLSQSNTFKDWFYLATEKYENNIAYIKKDNLGRNNNIIYHKVKRHVSFLAYSHIEEKLTNEKVVIIGRNSYEWIVSYLSLLITGATAVPLDAGLKEEEIENSISRITPALVICDSTKLELIKTIKEKLNLKFKIYLTEKDDKTEEENILTIDDVIANVKETTTFKKVLEAIDTIKIDENATKILLFTSGTTSQSKIVELSNKNIISNLKAIQAVIPVTNKDTTLALLPFHHTFGIIGVLVVLFSGGTIAFVESMKKFKDNIKEYSPTLLFLVPAVLELVYKKIQSGIKKSGKEELVNKMIKLSNKLLEFNIDIRRLLFKSIINELGGKIKFAFSGAAPIKKELIEAYENFGIHIFQGYGMTETSPVISAENYCKKNPGSVGFPIPNVTVKIHQPDENGIGEILVQGDNVFKGYMNDKEKTDEVIIDNWCHTGDIGYIDENGFIFITGRQKDMIVLDNGKKIFPEEIEHVLMDLEYIKDVLVYADNSLGDDDLKLTAKIRIDKKEIQSMFKNLEYNQILDKIWNDIKEINTTFPKYKYIKDLLVTEEDFIKTTTLKIKRFKEIEKTKEELENGKTISIKNISTKEK